MLTPNIQGETREHASTAAECCSESLLARELREVSDRAHAQWMYENLPGLSQELLGAARRGLTSATLAIEEHLAGPLESFLARHQFTSTRVAGRHLCDCSQSGPLIDLREDSDDEDEGDDDDEEEEEYDDEEDDEDDEDDTVHVVPSRSTLTGFLTSLVNSPPAITRARTYVPTPCAPPPLVQSDDEDDDESDDGSDAEPRCALCSSTLIPLRARDLLLSARW